MLGVLCPGQGKLRAERVDILGLRVLWVNVPTGGVWEKRRAARAERLLIRQGIRRRLPVRTATEWKVSLPPVEPRSLYRALAAELALAILKRNGIRPEESTVALVGDAVDGDMAAAARNLCPQVRTLLIRANYGGGRLAQLLYREFGAAAVADGRADVRVRFSGAPQPGELVLCDRPQLLGLEPELPETVFPEQLEPLPLIAALWQSGRITVKELRLRDNDGNYGCEDWRNMV